MLIIRKEQMAVLSQYMRRQFEHRLMMHLRTAFPERLQDIPEAELLAMIQGGIDKAAAYGVELEDDVERYVEYMVPYGSDFDTNPQTAWAGEILRTEHLDGSAKIASLDEKARLLSEKKA